MAAYNFQKRFIVPIQEGWKEFTLRPLGLRRHGRVDELLQLYTGMRTIQCRKIVPDPTCTQVIPTELDFTVRPSIKLSKKWYRIDRDLAVKDGFLSVDDMADCFTTLYGPRRDKMVLIGWGEV